MADNRGQKRGTGLLGKGGKWHSSKHSGSFRTPEDWPKQRDLLENRVDRIARGVTTAEAELTTGQREHLAALIQCNWDIGKAAELMGVSKGWMNQVSQHPIVKSAASEKADKLKATEELALTTLRDNCDAKQIVVTNSKQGEWREARDNRASNEAATRLLQVHGSFAPKVQKLDMNLTRVTEERQVAELHLRLENRMHEQLDYGRNPHEVVIESLVNIDELKEADEPRPNPADQEQVQE